jgi:flagellar biosynthesis chaperone FliJ
MTRGRKMQSVAQLVGLAEQGRERRLAELSRELRQQEHQLDLLRQYRVDTARAQSQSLIGMSIDVRALREGQSYLSALDRVIAQGEQRRQGVAAEYARLHAEWLAQRRKVEAIQQVATRYLRDESRALELRADLELGDYPRPRPE